MTNPNKDDSIRQFTLPQRYFEHLDQIIRVTYGISFEELAEEDPAASYEWLNRVMKWVGNTALSVTVNDSIQISRELDGKEAASGFARQIVKNGTRDTAMEPVDVMLTILPMPPPEDGADKPAQVFIFHVEPPDAAFE